jgi:N-acetylmuramoyl-L-alanine amidase
MTIIKPHECQGFSGIMTSRTTHKRYRVWVLIVSLAFTLLWLAAATAFDRLTPASAATIVLDPGHGGDNSGARGPTGSLEKDVCLALAQTLAAQLTPTHRVILTRSGDYDVDPRIRTATANHDQADVLISLHCGGGFLHTASGMAVYYWKPGSDQGTPPPHGEASNSNRWDQTQRAHLASSRRLAEAVQQSLARMSGAQKVKLHQAPLLVLKGAAMPAVLIEIGYITHPATEKDLLSPQYRLQLAKAIQAGITVYLQEQPAD